MPPSWRPVTRDPMEVVSDDWLVAIFSSSGASTARKPSTLLSTQAARSTTIAGGASPASRPVRSRTGPTAYRDSARRSATAARDVLRRQTRTTWREAASGRARQVPVDDLHAGDPTSGP